MYILLRAKFFSGQVLFVGNILRIFTEQHAAEKYLHHGALLSSHMLFQFSHQVLPSWSAYFLPTNLLSNSWEHSLGTPQRHAIQQDRFKAFHFLLGIKKKMQTWALCWLQTKIYWKLIWSLRAKGIQERSSAFFWKDLYPEITRILTSGKHSITQPSILP